MSAFAAEYNIGGVYKATGQNPNGTGYNGTVTVTKSGETYKFNWKVGASYSGTGTLSGNKLTVDWGDRYPVIYLVKDGGNTLDGTWANGAAKELLKK